MKSDGQLRRKEKDPTIKVTIKASYLREEAAFLNVEVCNFHSNFLLANGVGVEVIIHGTVQKVIVRAITNSAFSLQLSKEHVGVFCLLW
jgi:hypothetical protein